MPIITGDEKRAVGNEMGGVVDAGSAFTRVEPLLTAEQLRSRFLFGIPMWSALPDPVTRKRVEYTPEMQKDAITRAVNRVELHGGFDVQPQQHTKRLPFDRQEYYSLGYFQLPHKPVTHVLSLLVKPAGNTYSGTDPSTGLPTGAIYSVSPAWIEPGNLRRGQVNVVPLMPATVGGYVPLPSPGSGGAAFITILGSMGWVPAFWEISYITGFPEGKVPVVVNELVGTVAAIAVLSELGATNRIGQYSVGLDGAQQSVDTGGPNVYQARIQQLQDDKTALLSKLKKTFGQSLFSGQV